MPYRLHVDNREAKGPAIVLIPGGPGLSGRVMEPLAAALSGVPVVTVSPPGTGRTPGENSYSFQGLVQALEMDLAALPFSRFVVAGFSFGGLVAAALATRGRIDVRAFVGIASPLSMDAFARSDRHVRATQTPAMTAAEAAFLAEPTDQRLVELLTALAPVYFTRGNQEIGIRYLSAEEPNAALFLAVYGELLAGLIPSAVPALAGLSIPKLVIAGEEDGMTPAATLEADAAAIGASFHPLKDASHFVHYERPREVARLLEGVLSSVA